MTIWMRRRAVLLTFLGLLLGGQASLAQEEEQTFGTCSLSLSETGGECPYNARSSSGPSSNGTLRGGIGMMNTSNAYVPLDISVSMTAAGSSHATAPTNKYNKHLYNSTSPSIGGGSIRSHATNKHHDKDNKPLNNSTNPSSAGGSIRAQTTRQRDDHDSNNDNNTIKSHWGEDQTVGTGVTAAQIQQVVQTTDHYMRHVVYKQKQYRKVRKQCINQHASCSQWAIQGECWTNRNYMQLNCAPTCRTCEMLDVQKRCPVDSSSVSNVWGPGDPNRLFERITTTDSFYMEQYGPIHILSRPHLSRKERTRRAGHNNKVKEDGPWLVSLDNFLTPQECLRLIELGAREGYEPSSEVGNARIDGTRERIRSRGRTSYNAWCGEECEQDETAQEVLQKLHNLTGIPQENMEHLQLLRYEEGQQYATHYDFSHYERERPQGSRLLTVYLYLNDVQKGGETEFTGLKRTVTITPKRGRALVWPNVLDHDPDSLERRTKHRALPIGKGSIKYGINAWFHQRDFRTPHSLGCTA